MIRLNCGIAKGAASSKVMVTPLSTRLVPASDISITAVPFGATSRMSRSAGYVCCTLLSVTVILFTGPDTPETVSVAG